jgi:microcompartment protein CcmL/EutN
VAEIASFVVVDAGVGGAAKAAETVVATIPNMSETLVQYLPIKEDTEEQEELWVKRVIGVLLARTTAETLVPTVTFYRRRTYCTKVAPIEFIDWPLSR